MPISRPLAETMPERHRSAEAERVAHRHHPRADLGRARSQLHERQVGAIGDLEQCEIGAFVRTHDLGVELGSIIQQDLHIDGVVDHVIIGDDVAVRRDDEAGALRPHEPRPLTVAEPVVGLAEAAEELFKGRAFEGIVLRRFFRRAGFHSHRYNGRLHRVDDRHEIGDRYAGLGRLVIGIVCCGEWIAAEATDFGVDGIGHNRAAEKSNCRRAREQPPPQQSAGAAGLP